MRIVVVLITLFISLFAFEEIRSDNFDSKIEHKKVLVEFYAPWCIYCKELKSNLEELQGDLPKDIEIFQVNLDKNEELKKRFSIRFLPTLIYFKNSNLLEMKSGTMELYELKRDVQKYMY